MNICVFAKKGILFENIKKGNVLAICVPSGDQKRQFSDIANPSKKMIKERYGILSGEPLYRETSGVVTVFGTLPSELYNLKNEVKVFFPEDLLSDDINVVYYAIGESVIVHSVRMLNADGGIGWNSIFIELDEKGSGIIRILENLISERVVSNNDEKIMVVYTDISDGIKEELTQHISPYVDIIRPMSELKGYKDVKPLYVHKDNTILMLVITLIAMILFGLSMFYYYTGNEKLEKRDLQIQNLRQEFKASLSKRRLKKVSNPQVVKNSIEKTFKAKPSSLIHAGSEVASLFGVLVSIELEKRRPNRANRTVENNPEDDIVYIVAQVRNSNKDLLVDQERLAKSVYETRRWIRSIERVNKADNGTLLLKIGIYVGESGGVQ
ncbi:MAG: hypothetical protein GY793_09440 [Proteobacteria bacterium]|nr:hypothetical protein [Pseudomonadota bacterium]